MSEAGKVSFDAATGQRERVMSTFDSQRSAIIRAVDEQRLAAMAPIHAMQGQVMQGQAMQGQPIQSQAAVRQAAAAPRAPSAAASQQSAVVAEIVLTIKALVAEEVRGQLLSLLQAADSKQRAAMGEPPAHAG